MFEQVKQEIDDKIKTNGNNEITATRLNDVLQDMMDASAEVIEEVQQSVGTQVEANPIGEATETMQTIKIGETIYTAPQGPAGITPHIGDNGDWYIGDQDTGVQAEGQDGTNGTNGITPTINPSNKHWMIGETDTGIVAEGQNGQNAVNPFKGLFSSYANLTSAFPAPLIGDYAYVINQSPAGTASIYVCNTAGTWTDSQDDVDLSNVNINGGLTQTAKNLILSLFRKAVYIVDDAEEDIDDLEEEFEDMRTLRRIEATFTQGGNVIYSDATLDSLKQYLTVEAYYDNGTHDTVDNADVLLSGTLTVGTSTITAAYEGETDDFPVTVTAAPAVVSIAANYTGGNVVVNSNINDLKADLTVTATLDNTSTRVLAANEYSLSGDLTTTGTAQITVTYLANSSITTTFNVTVVSQIATISLSNAEILKKVNNIAQHTAASNPVAGVPYCQGNSPQRCCYPQFDKLLDGGKTYRVVVSSNYAVNVGVQLITQSGLNKVANSYDLAAATPGNPSVDSYDTGWLSLTDGEVTTAIPQYSTGNSPDQLIKAARFAFKLTNSSVIPNDITISLEMYEVE